MIFNVIKWISRLKAEVPTVLTGPRLFLRSDDRPAGIKKDEQQHEAAHKSPEGHTYQRLPEPHGPHEPKVPTAL